MVDIPSAFEITINKLRAGPLRLRQKVAAQKLGIGQTMLRKLIKSGRLESDFDGKCRYIYTESVIRYLQRLHEEQHPTAAIVARMSQRKRQRVALAEDQ